MNICVAQIIAHDSLNHKDPNPSKHVKLAFSVTQKKMELLRIQLYNYLKRIKSSQRFSHVPPKSVKSRGNDARKCKSTSSGTSQVPTKEAASRTCSQTAYHWKYQGFILTLKSTQISEYSIKESI